MDAKKTDALVDVIRAILGPSDKNISKERIVTLLVEAGNDPNKAVDLYFQAEAANGAEFKQNDVEGDVEDAEEDENDVEGDDEWPPQAEELSDLLGGDVKKQIILDLLRRTNNNLQKAVEIYFVEHGADADFDESSDEEEDNDHAVLNHNAPSVPRALVPTEPAASSAALPPAPSVVTPIAAQTLEPLHNPAVPVSPPAPSAPEPVVEASAPAATVAAAPSSVPHPEIEALKGPGTYEAILTESNFKWQIGTVFGRAVVQWVEPQGPAARAGIHKSDVLLAFGDSILNDKNCAAIVQQLSTEVPVPSSLLFRRAPEPLVHQSRAKAVEAAETLVHRSRAKAVEAAAALQNGNAPPEMVATHTPPPAEAAASAPAPVPAPVVAPGPAPETTAPVVAVEAPSSPPASANALLEDIHEEDVQIEEMDEQKEEAKPEPTPTPVALPSSLSESEPATVLKDQDGDVVMETADEVFVSDEKVEPKYGLQTLCRAVESMVDAIGDNGVEFKVIVDLLLLAEFSLDRAVNNFLNEDRLASDFRRVVGYNWDPANPAKCWGGEVYAASIPAGPLGLTVENILERTIVVDIKAGGAAERAAVKRSSWLVALNGVQITHLTHKETLRMIETASRPLQLKLIVVPQEEYKILRKQLSMNIRQQKTERPVPEQDRMSFRVFQLKIHQAVLVFPKVIAVALFQYLSTEEYHPPTLDSSYPNPLNRFIATSEDWERILLQETQQMQEERTGEMCSERRFLLNLFSQIHEYDDKGESTVIRTIQFLGWLAKRAADMQQFVSEKAKAGGAVNGTKSIGLFEQRYTLLLSVILHVLESLSIIENHATWDVMVNAFKMVIRALADEDVGSLIVPMMARHSISSSPTARIVPISLVAMVYPRVSGDVPVQLRGMFERMCTDDNPLVRRAVTSVIADLAISAGASAAGWTVQLLEKATADSHDIVRIFAVKSCIQLATNLRGILYSKPNVSNEEAEQALRLLYIQMVPMLNTYTSDSSWQVRLETARTLPAFCRAFGAEYTDIFVDHFVAMVRDPTVEVRRACAEGAYLMGDALIELALRSEKATEAEKTGDAGAESSSDAKSILESQSAAFERLSLVISTSEFVLAAQAKIMRSVLPATYRLATDVSLAVRQALAKSVGKSLQLVGGVNYDDLVPIFAELLDENQDASVRAALLEEVVRYYDSSSETITSMIFPEIHALLSSPQWRVRVKFVQCVGSWAERTDGAAVPLEFADGCLQLLTDPVHDVRATACSKLPVLVKSLGSDWLAEKGIPRISSCLKSTFHGRVTGLTALELLANELKEIEKLREVIETVVEESTSKTANLRFRALRTLGVLVPVLNDPSTTENTLEIVWDLARAEREADPDVREAAEATQALLEAHVS